MKLSTTVHLFAVQTYRYQVFLKLVVYLTRSVQVIVAGGLIAGVTEVGLNLMYMRIFSAGDGRRNDACWVCWVKVKKVLCFARLFTATQM